MDVSDVKPTTGQPLTQYSRRQWVHGQLEGQPQRQSVHLDAVDPVDEPATFPAAAGGCREDNDLVSTPYEAGRKVMDLHLDSSQAG
jgi:hypothetical protein